MTLLKIITLLLAATVAFDSVQGICKDDSKHCTSWASQGECKTNPDYMNVNCRKSCKLCSVTGGGTCKDNSKHCASWASQGECKKNPGYMKVNCKKSCNICGGGGTVTKPPTRPTPRPTPPKPTPPRPTPPKPTPPRPTPPKPTTPRPTPPKPTPPRPTPPKPTPPRPTPPKPTPPLPTPPKPTPPLPKPTPCVDKQAPHCAGWASTGWCQANPQWMKQNCAKSCKFCGSVTEAPTPPRPTIAPTPGPVPCKDDYISVCALWKRSGWCTKRKDWMMKRCKKTCNFCTK